VLLILYVVKTKSLLKLTTV